MATTSIDPADTAFSRWIRLRDRACMRCGSAVRLNELGIPISHEASHFKGRGKEATRFSPENVDTLCQECHSFFTENPDEHLQWQIQRKGQQMVDRIILWSNGYAKKERQREKIYWTAKVLEDFGIKI